MKSLKNKKGFTIVELVIVIAVIAILAAVLIPTFSGIVEKANESKRLQTAKNAYSTWIAKDTDNKTNALRQESVIGIKVSDNNTDYWFTVTKGVIAKSGTEGKTEVKAKSGETKIILTVSTTDGNVTESSAATEST